MEPRVTPDMILLLLSLLLIFFSFSDFFKQSNIINRLLDILAFVCGIGAVVVYLNLTT
jgi:hypothetical protein